MAIYNANGTKIGMYVYDAWGTCTVVHTTTSTSLEKSILSTYNPFRYRGYYYDVETGFYYLQSRYYNPSWGRFLNIDTYLSTGTGILSYNMYAYCNNNPVINIDVTGELFITITAICVGVGALIGGGIGGYVGNQYAKQNNVAEEDVWKYTVGGALLGGTVGGLAGYVAAPAVAAATGIAGVSITSAGVSVVGAGGGAIGIAEATTALQTYYPPNDGFSGCVEKITLETGTLLQRTGSLYGSFVAPYGTPSQLLSLPYDKIGQATTILEVAQPINVLAGRVAPWFGQIGGGTQYLLSSSVNDLINQGAIRIFGG